MHNGSVALPPRTGGQASSSSSSNPGRMYPLQVHLKVSLALGPVGAVRARKRGLARVDAHVGAQVLVAVAATKHPTTDAAHHHRHGCTTTLQHNTTQRYPLHPVQPTPSTTVDTKCHSMSIITEKIHNFTLIRFLLVSPVKCTGKQASVTLSKTNSVRILKQFYLVYNTCIYIVNVLSNS